MQNSSFFLKKKEEPAVFFFFCFGGEMGWITVERPWRQSYPHNQMFLASLSILQQ